MWQRIALLVLATGLFLDPSAFARGSAPSQSEVVSLLSTHRYSQLDRRFSAIQQMYERGAISDEQLRDAFRAFYFTTPSLAPDFDEWVTQFPRSYAAHLARGIYYKKVGEASRGNSFASETSAEQFREMDQAFVRASADFNESLSLTKKPLLTLLHQLTVAQSYGQKSEERTLLDRSIAMDPHNYVVRYAYMYVLQSRWGGSLEQMQLFLEQCRKAHLSAGQLRSLEAVVADEEAFTARYVDHDDEAALRAYRREAELDPKEHCGVCGPTEQAADTLLEEMKYEEAIRLYSKVLARFPKDLHALYNRGFSELQVKRPKVAVGDIRRAAELGSPDAQDLLGKMYLVGTTLPQDRDKAIAWLTRAADQGFEPSKALLELAKNRNAKFSPQPGTPQF